MSNKQRTTRTALALTALALMGAVGCQSDTLLRGNEGRVSFTLSGDVSTASGDAAPSADLAGNIALGNNGNNGNNGNGHDRPSRWFQTASVVVSSVLVRTLDGVLVNLAMDLPVTVDVVAIENGKEVQLPDGLLPAAAYDQVVIVMTAVQGVTHDGTLITIEPPGGGWTSVIPICPLEIVEGESATVGIKLMVRNSLVWSGNRFNFQPRFRPVRDCSTGNQDG